MYKRTIWQDHVEGIQEGTDLNAANFNNLEAGTMEANAMAAINAEYQRHANDIAKDNETIVLKLIINSPRELAFVDIPEAYIRNNTEYRVIPIITFAGSNVVPDGYIVISNKEVSHFQAYYEGTTKGITVEFHISGGMI